jgi:hypothetical protein
MRSFFLLLALLLAAACATPPTWEKAVKADSPAAYRKFLEENRNDMNVPAALHRLAELEFAEAVKAGSIIAFKRFLAEFPDSRQAEKAGRYLAELRLKKAREENTAQAYMTFLQIYPEGELSAGAKAALMEMEFAALKPDDIPGMKRFLAFHPSSPHMQKVEAMLDDAEFASASREGEAGLTAYLNRRRTGPHTAEARGLLLSSMFQRSLGKCSLKKAAAIFDDVSVEYGLSSLHASLVPKMEEGRRVCLDRKALLSLDRKALGSLVAGKSRYSAQAAQALKLAVSRPSEFSSLKELTGIAVPKRDAGKLKDLVALAASKDPIERYRAARLLAYKSGGRPLDALLELLSDYFIPVRGAAASSAGLLLQSMDPVARDKVFAARVARYETHQDAAAFLKLAVLHEAMGLGNDALMYYRKAAAADRFDPYLVYMLSNAEAARGDSKRALASSVEFLGQASGLMLEREEWLSGARGSAVEGKYTAFQYCAITRLAAEKAETAPRLVASEKEAEPGLKEVISTFREREAKAGTLLNRTGYAADMKSGSPCGGEGGAGAVVDARKARREAVLKLVAAEPPWLEALLEDVSAREPDKETRKLAADALAARRR